MKILELCHFSAGICGVWQRVKQESELLSKKGHEVVVFSSNSVKGTNELASAEDKIGNVKIERFPFRKFGGESFMYWFDKNAQQKALDFHPDIIIAHSYRHLHTTKALKLAKKLKEANINCKVFLVTHAPFARTRGLLSETIVLFYDNIIGRLTLNNFNKVITITKWEEPYLLELGLKKEKMEYIPNGIPEDFFKYKSNKKNEFNKILFLGRISPIKSLETLIKSLVYANDKKIIIEIVGPAEEEYKKKLDLLINNLNLKESVVFSSPIYDLKEKIKKIDSCKIFVLPSKAEGMPQALVEAMSRQKIVIASNNFASKDLIQDTENGFLFNIGDEKALAEKINYILNKKNQRKILNIRKNARKSVEKFSWKKIIQEITVLFNED